MCRLFPVATSQILTVCTDVDATILPSGENASPMKISQWSSKVSNIPSLSPVTASQSKMVLSRDVEATILPSGENAVTGSEWYLPIYRTQWANARGL